MKIRWNEETGFWITSCPTCAHWIGVGGFVRSIMRLGARDDVIYRSTKRSRVWAVWVMASLKTSRGNNSQVLRCFIELKYLKKLDKIMLHCCHWHKYFFPSRNVHFLLYIQNQTWPQGAFHWQCETEVNSSLLWTTVILQKPKPLTYTCEVEMI